MGLDKQASDANRQPSTGQRRRLRSPTIGAIGPATWPLQRMGDVEYDRGQCLHFVDTQHVDHKIVVAEAGTALAQQELFVTCFAELLDDVPHLRRGEELRLLDVDHRTRLRNGRDQVGLSRKKRRQLNDVGHLRRLPGLPRFMDVCQDRNIELFFYTDAASPSPLPSPGRDRNGSTTDWPCRTTP